jgi:hypothetical protein
VADKKPLDKEKARLICPYLKRTVMPICRAKKGTFTAPNIYELQQYCMNIRYKECPVFNKYRSSTKAEKEKKKREEDAIV